MSSKYTKKIFSQISLSTRVSLRVAFYDSPAPKCRQYLLKSSKTSIFAQNTYQHTQIDNNFLQSLIIFLF